RALERSPVFSSLVLGEQNSRLTYKNAWSSMLPEADVSAQNGYYKQGGNSYYSQLINPQPWSSLLALNVNENLYDNGVAWRNKEIAAENRDIGSLSLRKGKLQLYLNVA